jgi:hypothetical protein
MRNINNLISENRDIFTLGKKVFKNNCGSNDETNYWKHRTYIYQLGINYSLPYVSLQVYNTNNNDSSENPIECSNEVFFQIDYELEEILGKNWENKSTAYIRKVLENYCF